MFQDLLKKYFVSNDHRVTVEMKPDSELEAKIIEEETKYLSDIKSSMTSTEIEKVIESTKILKEAQQAPDSPEAKATIPRLELSDIDPKNKEIPLDVVRDDALGATFITHNLQTNGILYADIAFDYSNVELDDLELLPLFSRMLMETGTTTYDQTQLSRKIGANTGGISISYYNDLKSGNGFVTDSSEFLLNLLIRGKVVVGSVPVLMELVTDILLNAKLDNQKRAIEMLKESKVRKESSVLSNGHSYGSARIGARSSFLGYLGELTGGITSVRAAGKLLETAEKDWPSIQARLEKLRKQIIAKGKVYVNLTGDEKTLESAVPVARKFVENLPEKSSEAACKSLLEQWKANPKLLPKKNEGFTMPSQVNYVCYGGQIMQPGEKVTGASAVASRFLSIGYLWDQVRVVGGAYGGFARFSDATGRFVYMSYRDPNLAKTLKIYEDAAEVLGEEEISSEDLLQAIVGTVGDLDGPMTPDQKGFSSFTQFLTGESAELRQTWRTEILNASPKDFKDFAASLKKLRETGSVAVFGSKTSMEAANADLPDHLKLEIEQAFGSN